MLRKELDQARRDAAVRPRDHQAVRRATNKRLKPEEHTRIQQTLWTATGASNDLQAMRQLVEHCLQVGSNWGWRDMS